MRRGNGGAKAWLLLPLLAGQFYGGCAMASGTPDGNTTSSLYALMSRMDAFQGSLSYRIRVFSSNVDRRISGAFDDSDVEAEETDTERFFITRWFDGYFLDDTHLDHTNRSYLRLRGGYTFDSKAENHWISDVKARIRLPLSQERLQLFIGDDTREGSDLTAAGTGEESSGAGLRFTMQQYVPKRMSSGTSIGISSLDNPYAKLYVDYTLLDGDWLVKPVQTFRYSKESEFEEWTDFFVAKRLPDEGIVQLLLQRSTRSHVDAMEYMAELSYWKVNRHRIGFQPYVALYGRTKALGTYDNGERIDSGIYNYAAGLIWRRSVLRDYLFFQAHPSVMCHEHYAYRANYLLHLTFEIYFGNL